MCSKSTSAIASVRALITSVGNVATQHFTGCKPQVNIVSSQEQLDEKALALASEIPRHCFQERVLGDVGIGLLIELPENGNGKSFRREPVNIYMLRDHRLVSKAEELCSGRVSQASQSTGANRGKKHVYVDRRPLVGAGR